MEYTFVSKGIIKENGNANNMEKIVHYTNENDYIDYLENINGNVSYEKIPLNELLDYSIMDDSVDMYNSISDLGKTDSKKDTNSKKDKNSKTKKQKSAKQSIKTKTKTKGKKRGKTRKIKKRK